MSWLPCAKASCSGSSLQLVDQSLGHPSLDVHPLGDVEEQPFAGHARRDRHPAARPAAELATELAQQLGQPPAPPPQPSVEGLTIRVVQRPRFHAGDTPVLRHHRRVVARHRRLAAASDRQPVGTESGGLGQDVHPLAAGLGEEELHTAHVRLVRVLRVAFDLRVLSRPRRGEHATVGAGRVVAVHRQPRVDPQPVVVPPRQHVPERIVIVDHAAPRREVRIAGNDVVRQRCPRKQVRLREARVVQQAGAADGPAQAGHADLALPGEDHLDLIELRSGMLVEVVPPVGDAAQLDGEACGLIEEGARRRLRDGDRAQRPDAGPRQVLRAQLDRLACELPRAHEHGPELRAERQHAASGCAAVARRPA